jgi:DNA-binding GntR family transcriptional regulator
MEASRSVEIKPKAAASEIVRIDAAPVVSQRVADVLAQRILSGELAPGVRIKQDDLADELNTSRIPVRDALRILEARGLVTLRANAGARVTSMTLHELVMSYEIRERIEPLLLGDSLPQVTDGDLAEMRETLREMEETDDLDRFQELDRLFQWISYRRHRSPQLAQIVERLWDTTQSYRRAYLQAARPPGSRMIMPEHLLYLEAVERRDVETAGAVLVLRLRRTRVQLAEQGAHLGAD